MAQLVKNLLPMQETWVQSLGWEEPLEKGKATHYSILASEFHGLYSPWGCKELDTDLIDRVPDELWNEVRDIVQETGINIIPMEKKCKKAKWLSGEAL